MASSGTPSDPAEKIQGLAQEQAVFRTQVEFLKEQFKLAKEISDLRADFNKAVGTVKRFGTALTLSAAVLGIAGYKSYIDFEKEAQKKLEAYTQTLRELTEKESARARAYSALMRREYDSAIRIFEQQFELNPYDLDVTVPLLNAYDETDNWEEAEKRIVRLEQDEQQLSRINDSLLLNNIAVIRIQEGVDDPAKLESGANYLKRSAAFIRGDDEDSWTYFHINSWLAALAARDMTMARKEANQIAVKNSTVTLDEWYKVRKWRFFRQLFRQNARLEPEVAKMWEEQKKKLLAMRTGKK